MMYYDKHGQEITLQEWCGLQSVDHKRIAYDEVGDFVVSTVWLGLDHSFGMGPPIIFETMVFPNQEGNFADQYCERYATELQAIEGHAQVVAHIREEGKAP